MRVGERTLDREGSGLRHRFELRAPGAARVVLVGETTDWRNGIALADAEDDRFVADVELPDGVYQYKLLVDDAWTLDAACARTRSGNNVVAIHGAPEPLLFAAAPPWVEELDRGGIRVLVGVRKPAPPPALRVDGRPVPLVHAFDEEEHAFFVATVAATARVVPIATDGFETTWVRPPASERVPDWWRGGAIYGIFVDRFRPAIDREGWEIDPGRRVAAGGHLDGIRRSLDELAELGATILYLTPVHVGASCHRYDVVDPFVVDPALGGEEAYAALVRDARARGIRIVQDVSFAHAGRGFPAYDAGRLDWFQKKDDGSLRHYGKRTDAPLFDLASPEVEAMVIETVRAWAKRGASGLRLDMTAEVPFALGRKIRRTFREVVPDGLVFGEVVPLHAWRWRQEGVVDAATDFGFHATVTELVTDPRTSAKDAFAKLERLALLQGGDPSVNAVRFLSTHDHPRLATLAAATGALARMPLAFALLATLPGVPMLLYGEEIGMRSDGSGLELEDVWPDRAPMPWRDGARDPALRALVRSLLHARRESKALREGTLRLLFADESTLVYRREADDDVVDVALNFADAPKTLELEDDELPIATAIHGDVSRLPPHGFALVRRSPAVGTSRSRRNLALRDLETKDARLAVESRPTRFFFSVTERCNLRCAHCITHAPERTKDGTARTMTPAVLDALKGDLALGTYFAFVHGGESLTTPIFWEALAAIRQARAGEPYVAHLLTNGVLFGPSAAERLVRAGVSSVSVSLDGATAATNDAIRLGGRFADVARNVAETIAWRDGERIDLRVGLSFVVLRQNLGELDAFVDLAKELGVDWVKLEEGAPATDFAKRSLVTCDAPDARAAIARAIARGRAHGLVMVDHTRERAVWRCKLDDETRAFLEADEWANRADIHPCRTPWETICVEPNGDVRAVDFFGPVLGNVVVTPVARLWNAPDAQGARDRSRGARICGAGPVVCL